MAVIFYFDFPETPGFRLVSWFSAGLIPLLNEEHIYHRSNANNNTIGAYGNFNPPRTFGVEATIEF